MESDVGVTILLMVCVEVIILSQVHAVSRRSKVSHDAQDTPWCCLGKVHRRDPARVSVKRNTSSPILAEYSHDQVYLKHSKDNYG